MTGGARVVALRVLERVRRDDAFANLVLPSELDRARLEPRDAALATELAYGTLRTLGTLDWVIERFASRPVAKTDTVVLDALRLGAYQLVYTGVASHAAVSETVAAAGLDHGRGGYVNAVLRRVADARGAIAWPDREQDPIEHVALTHAHPRWIVELWTRELGADLAESLCAAGNVFPGVGIRVNRTRITRDELIERLRAAGLDAQPGSLAPEAVLVRGGGRPAGWPGFSEGHFAIQDESSALAAGALDVSPGSVVVDLCAGPGGKAAAAAERGACVLAIEPRPERARLVADAARRLRVPVTVVQADGRRPPIRDGVDSVLVDAPCSGLGVLRRRPEARWRVRPSDVERSAALQSELVDSGFGLLRPGGTLVYAVCTVTAAETTQVVRGLIERRPDAEIVDVLPGVPRPSGLGGPGIQLLPPTHGTDGMYIAKVRRTQ